MTAPVTEAAPAAQRRDFIVHGHDGTSTATVLVSAVNQTTAIRAAGVQRQGARVHAAWFDCRVCQAVTR